MTAKINCSFANRCGLGAGMPVSTHNKNFFADCGGDRRISVARSVCEADSIMCTASLWPAEGKAPRMFGMPIEGDEACYLLLQTSFEDAGDLSIRAVGYPFAGTPTELESAMTETGRRFIYRMLPGDEIVYAAKDRVLQGVRIEDGVLAEFIPTTEQLACFSHEDFRTVRGWAFQELFDGFKDGADGGADAMDMLLAARATGLLGEALKTSFLREIGPRFVELAKGYGWEVSVSGSQVVVVRDGVSCTMYTQTGETKSRAQREAGRAALRLERLKDRPVGVQGSKDNSFGKKKQKANA